MRHRVACLEARSAALLGRIEQRGIPAVEGFGSATGWLMARTGDPAPVCRSRVGVARALRSMPLTREVFADWGAVRAEGAATGRRPGLLSGIVRPG